MRTILSLILLSALFAGVTASVFYWLDAGAAQCQGETQLDYSGLKIGNYFRGGVDARYLFGDIVLRKKLLSTVRVHYQLQKLRPNSESEEILDSQSGESTMCEFINGFSYKYLLPMFDKRNDFPIPHPEAKPDCEIEPNTYHIFKANNIRELNANTELTDGLYRIIFTHMDDGKCIGGFNGSFISANILYYYL